MKLMKENFRQNLYKSSLGVMVELYFFSFNFHTLFISEIDVKINVINILLVLS